MNLLKLDNTGGFPMDTNVLAFMQSAYGLFNALGNLAGNLSIIQGCEVTGSNVSDGVVYINGEILPFRGGTASANVVIKEEVKSFPFEDGQPKPVEKIRYASFGGGSPFYPWADFKRILPLKKIQKSMVPVGLISMWSGEISNIPTGWFLCDGGNGTPDLRGKFVVGYAPDDLDYNEIGKKGGSKSVTLTEEQIPSHQHRGSTDASGSHTHGYKDIYYSEDYGSVVVPEGSGSGDSDNNNKGLQINRTTDTSGSHRHSFVTEKTGGNQSHENRPPFYTLAYIMYKGI